MKIGRGGDLTERFNRQVARQRDKADKQASQLLERATELAARVETIPNEVARRMRPRPRRGRLAIALLLGVGIGYLAAYLTDREQGRARRAEIARQLESVRLEASRTAQRTATVAADKATGVKARIRSQVDPNVDDLTLLDRVESEVFGDPSIPKGKINVMVVDGKAVLRGQVEEPQIGAIEAAVRKVVGVKEVENLLHPAGTAAPNKAASRAVTDDDGGSPI